MSYRKHIISRQNNVIMHTKKNLFILLVWLCLCTTMSWSQIPAGLSYQGVARNNSGQELRNTAITVSATIFVGGISHTEIQSTYTDDFGVFTIVIGGAKELVDLPWDKGNATLSVTISSSEGTVSGTSPVNAVPYAIYAARAERLSANASIEPAQISSGGAGVGQVLRWNGVQWAPAATLAGNPFAESVAGSSPAFPLTDKQSTGHAIQASRGKRMARLASDNYAGEFIGGLRAEGASGQNPENAGEFIGNVVVNGGFTVARSDNTAIDVISENSGSRLNLNNANGGIWSIRNSSGILRFGRDGTEVISMVYPSGLLNPASLRPFKDNELSLGVSYSRWTVVYATNGTINTSDRNLKRNMLAIKYGLEEVMRLNPVSYQWKTNNDHGKTHLGFIAQEVEEIIPEVVTVGEDGRYGMNYSELVPVLVKSIQELSEKVKFLESMIGQRVDSD